MRSVTGAILAAMPAAPEAPAPSQELVRLLALLRGQHLSRITEGLREALARRLGERHLLGAERLNGRPIDLGLGQQGGRALPAPPAPFRASAAGP